MATASDRRPARASDVAFKRRKRVGDGSGSNGKITVTGSGAGQIDNRDSWCDVNSTVVTTYAYS